MLDETEQAPDAEAQDDAADAGADDAIDVSDAGGDDAVDLADLGGEVETADEPAVTAEELMEIPDAPEVPGADQLTDARANEAMELGAQAAQDGDSEGNQIEGEPDTGDTGDA
jgi:hypothetical protein